MLRTSWAVVLGLTMVGATVLAQDRNLTRASEILKMEVRTASNEVVGEVKDIVLDRDTGGVAYVIAKSRLPKESGRFLAVPWSALTPTADRKALVLAVSNEALALVPRFDPGNWPDMTDPRWVSRIRDAYGVRARTEVARQLDEARVIGVLETSILTPPTAGVSRATAVVAGTVKEVFPGETSEVVIATDQGDIDVVLGPFAYLERQRLTFSENANVKVKGRVAYHEGRSAFVVTEAMTHPGQWVRVRNDDLSPRWLTAVAYPDIVRHISGTVDDSGNGWARVITEDEGVRTVSIAPANYFGSRHWRLRNTREVGVTGYDDPETGDFMAIMIYHENETWRVRWDDGTPVWK